MTFSHQRRVEFRDTDAAGIVHFSVFFPMMEEAEHAALRHVGLSVMQPAGAAGHLSWPRVAADCQYLIPARFEDLLRIEVVAERIGLTSVSYAFGFFRDADPAPRQCLATGKITAVCCHWTAGQVLRKTPIPEHVRSALSRLLSVESAD
jgi:acyl-CoA thioester hydrolase